MQIKITLVDDHPIMLNGMELGLSKYSDIDILHTFSSGEELLENLDKETTHPDIAVIDFQMPTMNGIELTKILTKKHPEIRIVIHSFNTENFIIQKALHSGASAFLSKNGHSREMYTAIKTVFNGDIHMNDLVKKSEYIFTKKGIPAETRFSINAEFSKREKEVILHICQGHTYKDIAKKMNISKRTVETHKDRIFTKLGIAKNIDIIVYASKMGWV